MTTMYASSTGWVFEMVQAEPTLHELGEQLQQTLLVLQAQGKIPALFAVESINDFPVLGRQIPGVVDGRGDDGHRVANCALTAYRAYMDFASGELAALLWQPDWEIPFPSMGKVDKLAGRAVRRIHRFHRVLADSDLVSGRFHRH